MKKLSFFLTIMLIIFFSGIIYGKGSYVADEGLRDEAKQGFEKVLDLWRDGKYAELYDRTYGSGESREHFAERLASAPRRPACCWEKMQEVKVNPEREDKVNLWARIGLEGGGISETATRSFKLKKEYGVWKVSRKDILTLSGASKKRKRYIRRTFQNLQ